MICREGLAWKTRTEGPESSNPIYHLNKKNHRPESAPEPGGGGECSLAGIGKTHHGKEGGKIMKDDRGFHLRLQEFCDCFMETDYQKELEAASRGMSGDPSSNEEELALKFLGLAILYGATQEIKNFSIKKGKDGKVLFALQGKGAYQLPPPPPPVADRIFSIARSIMHLQEDEGTLPFSLGLRNDHLELKLKMERKGAEESLTVVFPQP
jgi:hypothetical protein